MTWCGYWGPKATTRHLKPWEIQTQDTLTELAKTRLWNYKGCLVSIYSQCFPAKSLRTKSNLALPGFIYWLRLSGLMRLYESKVVFVFFLLWCLLQNWCVTSGEYVTKPKDLKQQQKKVGGHSKDTFFLFSKNKLVLRKRIKHPWLKNKN